MYPPRKGFKASPFVRISSHVLWMMYAGLRSPVDAIFLSLELFYSPQKMRMRIIVPYIKEIID